MKIEHTPAPWESCDGNVIATGETPRGSPAGRLIALVYSEDGERHRWYFECGNGNSKIVALSPRAPHECDVPNCPGDLNRRKLEMFAKIMPACEHLLQCIEGTETEYLNNTPFALGRLSDLIQEAKELK